MNPIRKRWTVVPSTFAFLLVLYGLLALLTIVPGKALFFTFFTAEQSLSRWSIMLLALIPLVALTICTVIFFYFIIKANKEKHILQKRISFFKTMLFSGLTVAIPFLLLTIFVIPSLMERWRLPQINEALNTSSEVTSAYYLEREGTVRKISDKFLTILAINRFQKDSVGSWTAINDIDSHSVCIQIMSYDEKTDALKLIAGAGNSDEFLDEEEIEILPDGIHSNFATPNGIQGYNPPKDKIICVRTIRQAKRQYKAIYISDFYSGFDAGVSALRNSREQFLLNEKINPITKPLWIALSLLLLLPSLLFLPIIFYCIATRFTAVWEVLVESIERKTAGSNTLHIRTSEINGEEKIVSEFINKDL